MSNAKLATGSTSDSVIAANVQDAAATWSAASQPSSISVLHPSVAAGTSHSSRREGPRGRKRQTRPSTAHAFEQNYAMIPSSPSLSEVDQARLSPSIAASSSHGEFPHSRGSSAGSPSTSSKPPWSNTSQCDASEPDVSAGALTPDPQDTTTTSSAPEHSVFMESNYDWPTFITAYALGHWDPHRTPHKPQPSSSTSSLSRSHPSGPPEPSALWLKSLGEASMLSHSAPPELAESTSENSVTVGPKTPPRPDDLLNLAPKVKERQESLKDPDRIHAPAMSSPSSSGQSMHSDTTAPIPRSKPTTPLKAAANARLRNSFVGLGRNSGGPTALSMPDSRPSVSPKLSPDITAAAATMRWAASHVNIAPLAIPSPEHELTDPLRNINTTIPEDQVRHQKFWEGTQDVDAEYVTLVRAEFNRHQRLQTIEASPSVTPEEEKKEPKAASRSVVSCERSSESSKHAQKQARLPHPASAPLSRNRGGVEHEDYFMASPMQRAGSKDDGDTSEVKLLPPEHSLFEPIARASVPVAQRMTLARQTSAPLPGWDQRIARNSGDSINRGTKEEQAYKEHGYLVAPLPPDEVDRQRALHKFNIFKTGPDINFDRIAHLAKLVFNTKGVFISLVDSNEQWFKTAWGMTCGDTARGNSICSHLMLQRMDEPLVILDTHNDWRFARNPHVVNTPYIRFYAGAPLRTQDGYNIGTLTVLDDHPRGEFSPRQRHTLKEFAYVVMREMELWRDKIQLRIRDRIQTSMEQFSRECLEIDAEVQAADEDKKVMVSEATMDKIYDRAADLIRRTLDVENVIIMDVSHCEVLESMPTEGSVSVVMHHGDPQVSIKNRSLTTEEYKKLNAFFVQYPDGKISEGIMPACFRPFLPTHVQYALNVPVFNVDKRPFALICAYNESERSKRFLEGHELSYLRAIGVIILSAVLKRRMILADKAKSLFISNISHELRTPLHGILAAAELLADTPLNHSQISYLQTVQACGTSLVETVNHVLDFTKLSGNAKSGGIDKNVILPTRVNLMQLVEEAVDGCWVGHRARMSALRDSEIGSVYSPPKQEGQGVTSLLSPHVEAVIDTDLTPGDWDVICEKAGLRRVLMNIFGNSLKFTSDGFIHVALRESPHGGDTPPQNRRVELSVLDTGKGISQDFLKNRLFHPFSQENPMQTGTGLGLAIVNSIVSSDSIDGKVDVWSEEGVGTEIRVSFLVQLPTKRELQSSNNNILKVDEFPSPPSVSLVGFDHQIRGQHLLHTSISKYLTSWWGLRLQPEGQELGDIVIVNEDLSVLAAATTHRDTGRPYIIMPATRGGADIMNAVHDFERAGGFCRILHKPTGPTRLRTVMKLCLHSLSISRHANPDTSGRGHAIMASPLVSIPSETSEEDRDTSVANSLSLVRRNSGNTDTDVHHPHRPAMSPRAATSQGITSWRKLTPPQEKDEPRYDAASPQPDVIPGTQLVGTGGTLLEASVGTINSAGRKSRVLIVEDNSILRNLLAKWLSKKGIEFLEAIDGEDGVKLFKSEGHFDIVLLDMSMPNLDGIGATTEIRRTEAILSANRTPQSPPFSAVKILALTGMSTLEDKQRAFDAGVDGYLVKPVAFKTLDEMFIKLGISH